MTDSFHTKARIRNISTERMVQALDEGKIVIVAGFQGVDENYNITTLGRGGSDTTAVALAAVLGADACEIYTDVDGVYTTDPRIVPEARKIDRISYDEMLELASLGAGVMHSRSIEFAKKYGVPIHVRSSFSDAEGTWIVAEGDARRLGVTVTGAALAKDEARITILGVPDRPGVVHAIFRAIAAANIVVDMIVQNVATEGTTEVSFTVAAGDLAETLRAAEAAAKAIGASGVTHDAEVAKVSVVGLGMRTHTGVATIMFEALAEAGINIEMITTSEIKISVLVDRDLGRRRRSVPSTARSCLDEPIGDFAAPSPIAHAVRPDARSGLAAENGDSADGSPASASARDGGPGHLGRRARRAPGADHPVRRPRPARLRRPRLPRDRRRGRLRGHDRAERQHRGEHAPLVHGPTRRGRDRRAAPSAAVGPGDVSIEPDDRQALGHGRGDADPHRRRHPDVRRPGRARDQHRPDQHQRGPDQRRHRPPLRARGARPLAEHLRPARRLAP